MLHAPRTSAAWETYTDWGDQVVSLIKTRNGIISLYTDNAKRATNNWFWQWKHQTHVPATLWRWEHKDEYRSSWKQLLLIVSTIETVIQTWSGCTSNPNLNQLFQWSKHEAIVSLIQTWSNCSNDPNLKQLFQWSKHEAIVSMNQTWSNYTGTQNLKQLYQQFKPQAIAVSPLETIIQTWSKCYANNRNKCPKRS